MDALLGVLPSYTQLGMAALLPGAQLGINPADGTAVVDGQSASGTENRDKILKAYANGRAKAIQAEDFLNLPTSKEGAELIKEHDLIVVYHNRIDRIGDKRDTEADTCQAVEQAFEELDAILRKSSASKTATLPWARASSPVPGRRCSPLRSWVSPAAGKRCSRWASIAITVRAQAPTLCMAAPPCRRWWCR